MKLENIFKKIRIDNFKNKFFKILSKKRKLLLFVFFLFILIYAGYLWYGSVYNYSWDENKKQEYIKSKSGEDNSFDKVKFEKIVSEIERRKAEYQIPVGASRDIFGIE